MSGINITIGNWTHTTGFHSPLAFMIIYHLLVLLIYTVISLFIYSLYASNNRDYKNKKIDDPKRKLNRREQFIRDNR